MVKENIIASTGNKTETAPCAILFELETVAVNGRRAAFELIRSMLAEEKIEFTPAQFSRYCLRPLPRHYVAELLEAVGSRKGTPEKFIQDLDSGMAMFFSSEAILSAQFGKLIDETLEAGLSVNAVTALSEDRATALMDRLALTEKGVRLFAFEEADSNFPGADVYMKVSKQVEVSPRRSICFTDNSTSFMAAMSAGMRCIAIPNEFTEFQDFSGAEAVLSTAEDWKELGGGDQLCMK